LCIIYPNAISWAEVPLSLPVPITQHTQGPAVVQCLVIHRGAGEGANLVTISWVIVMCDTAGEVVPLAGYFGYCAYRRISAEEFSAPAG
jgi:hypothetical protein